jgi:hypothetical protein
MNARFTLHSFGMVSNAVSGRHASTKDKSMFGGTLKVAAWTAAAALSITLVSGDAFARPGGGRGGHGGHAGFHHGGPGFHGGAAHRGVGAYGGSHRGYYGHGAGIDRGVVRGGGPYRVGGRYHGGVWYGTGRHWWKGRWYNYGVGPCWLWSPIGYVWICG